MPCSIYNNEQFIPSQSLELVGKPVLKMSLFHLLNQGVTVDVVCREPVAGRFHADGRGEMGFAYTGWPEEDDVFGVFKEP